ncbi:MAG: aminopeptidase [Marinilabiliaceae bacterium]|nr:aminopeptidase [Marinilabiliaceae bacterium]
MNGFVITMALLMLSIFVSAQGYNPNEEEYNFTTKKLLATTSVKNQYRSGTCWSFSAISFLESEMMRIGRDSIDLSDMYSVALCYLEKGDKAVRMHGTCNFGSGGAAHDVMWVLKNYGMVPESVYRGLEYGVDKHNHSELDALLKSFIGTIAKENSKRVYSAWKKAYRGIVEAYLGELPEKFTFQGKQYTPRTFADNVVGLNADDYISFTSYTHHPFYESFVLEIPDNWLNEKFYNVPLDEMIKITDYAIENGYTVVWGADVSEDSFSFYDGVAVMPETDAKNLTGTDLARWNRMSNYDRKNIGLSEPVKEKEITQEMRQEAFDNYETTDDHGMHIVGTAVDQNGTEYYIIKNSWDSDNVYGGYMYISKAFFAYKTMDIMLHKDGVPKDIKTKIKL